MKNIRTQETEDKERKRIRGKRERGIVNRLSERKKVKRNK